MSTTHVRIDATYVPGLARRSALLWFADSPLTPLGGGYFSFLHFQFACYSGAAVAEVLLRSLSLARSLRSSFAFRPLFCVASHFVCSPRNGPPSLPPSSFALLGGPNCADAFLQMCCPCVDLTVTSFISYLTRHTRLLSRDIET